MKNIQDIEKIARYGMVYQQCLKKMTISEPKKEYSKRSITPVEDSEQIKPKKSLNTYQKFIQEESKRKKYKNTSPKTRMSEIAKEWKKITGNKVEI